MSPQAEAGRPPRRAAPQHAARPPAGAGARITALEREVAELRRSLAEAKHAKNEALRRAVLAEERAHHPAAAPGRGPMATSSGPDFDLAELEAALAGDEDDEDSEGTPASAAALDDDFGAGPLAQHESERPHPTPADAELTGEEPTEDDAYEPDLDQEDFNDEENFLTPTAGLAERRRELDRERASRELELGEETWWSVCPRCGERLSEHEFDSIKVERCESCGAACLDRGEIELLLSAEEDVLMAYRAKGLLQ